MPSSSGSSVGPWLDAHRDRRAAGVGLLAEPVLRTIQQGQINLLLAALVAADLLSVPRRYRGILIGIAAGIKLVPAAFALCLLARWDLGSILRLIATLGALGDAPRPVWVAATVLMPAFGIWWLVTTYANKGDERATTVAGA